MANPENKKQTKNRTGGNARKTGGGRLGTTIGTQLPPSCRPPCAANEDEGSARQR